MKFLNILFFIFCSLIFSVPCIANVKDKITISLLNKILIVQPKGLGLAVQSQFPNRKISIIVPCSRHFSQPISCNKKDNVWDITYQNGFRVNLSVHQNRFHIKIYPTFNQILHWPSIDENSYLKAYLIPEGEGLYIPVDDKILRPIIEKVKNEGPSLPFFGYLYDDFSITMILHTPYRNMFEFNNNCLPARQNFQYDFRIRDKQPFYEISFTFSKPHILEPSRVFKAFLKESGVYRTFLQKIKDNPDIEKLSGAIHAYVWGDGRTIKSLQELKNIGITKLWLGYEEKPNQEDKGPWVSSDYVNEEFIKLAKEFGYLIGPYDSWHTMQHQKDSDSHNTDFGSDFFPNGCVHTIDGKINIGFGGRGCHVSMTALDNIHNSIVYNRFSKFKSQGINTYFLDCHATGEAFDDYSYDHPQTIFEDIAIRKKHLEYLSGQQVVLGSETAAYWSIPFLAFSHGNFSTLYNIHWEMTHDKKRYGGWGPARRPQIFFKLTQADDIYMKRYDPVYRIPMWQAVFHESCVSTDRWEIPLVKFINLYPNRFLLEFLYGVPSIWSLDFQLIKDFSHILKQLSQDFTPLHELIMTEELSDFEFLTSDRTVQKTTFSDIVSIIANFRETNFQDIPPKSLKIQWLKSNKSKYVTPQPLNKIK